MAFGVGLAVVSTLVTTHGLDEMVIWQVFLAVPTLAYCAAALFALPPSRRTVGTHRNSDELWSTSGSSGSSTPRHSASASVALAVC